MTAIAVWPLRAEATGINDAEKENQANAALTYLKLVGDGALSVDKHTAISSHCGKKRRAEIEAKIQLARESHFQKNDKLSVEAQKSAAGFAAVLVRAENPINPLDTRIHGVALIRKKDRWLPAPLPGLFSNAGYGYDKEVERSVLALEAWMAKQKILRELDHRKKNLSTLKTKLLNIEKAAGFDHMSAEQVVTYFLEQCKKRNVLGIVACLGGGDQKSHESLLKEIKLVTEAIKNRDKHGHNSTWAFFFRPSCLSLVIESDDQGNVMAGHYNPRPQNKWSSGRCNIFTFKTDVAEGRTCIRLHTDNRGQQSPARYASKPELKNQFATIALRNTSAKHCQSPNELLDHLLQSVQQRDFGKFMELTPRQNDYCSKPENHSSILYHISSMWRTIPEHDGLSYGFSEIVSDDNLATVRLLSGQAGGGDLMPTMQIWMLKDEHGWHIIPHDIIEDVLMPADQQAGGGGGSTLKRLSELDIRLEKQELEHVFSATMQITLPLSLDAVSEDEAHAILRKYQDLIRNGHIKSSLAQCVTLEGSDKNHIMHQTLRHIKGAKGMTQDIEILGSCTESGWVGISAKTKSPISGEADYPLYIVINTASGPRIFANLDLRYPHNYGRKILNEENWRQFKNMAPAASVSKLQSIFNEHLKRCESDMAQIQK
ncbi:MAG: hypothetical protein ACPH2J_01060 [Akkermansiaceae bacterium]